MPRNKKPGYWNHRPSGQAYVRIDGKDHYLGPYDSAESRDRYEELIRGWMLNQSADRFAITIDELALRYIQHCESYYRKNGTPTTEVGKAREAQKIVVTLSGQITSQRLRPAETSGRSRRDDPSGLAKNHNQPANRSNSPLLQMGRSAGTGSAGSSDRVGNRSWSSCWSIRGEGINPAEWSVVNVIG